MSAADYASMDDRALMRAEIEILRRHVGGGVPWLYAMSGIVNTLIWISLWPLTLSGVMPLWLAFMIATLNCGYAHHPTHDAYHGNFGRPGSKTRWFNELVGHFGALPIMLPFNFMKLNHLEHHRFTNCPERDPDYGWSARNVWHAIWRSIELRQPGATTGLNGYARRLAETDTPEARAALRQGQLGILVFHVFLFAMAWGGYAIEAALIWWLPRHLGSTWIIAALVWAPHHPPSDQGRYRSTRVFRSPVGSLASGGIEYHLVHHLHPAIPFNRTFAAYRELLPILCARGVRFDGYPGSARPEPRERPATSPVPA